MAHITTAHAVINTKDPLTYDIHLPYIAQVMGRVSRFNGWGAPESDGWLVEPISLAQHSVLVVNELLHNGWATNPLTAVLASPFLTPSAMQLHAQSWMDLYRSMVSEEAFFDTWHTVMGVVVHDAAEAVVGDMITPLKRELNEFALIERKVAGVICMKLGINGKHVVGQTTHIKRADTAVTHTEARVLFGEDVNEWADEQLSPQLNAIGTDMLFIPWKPRKAASMWYAMLRGFWISRPGPSEKTEKIVPAVQYSGSQVTSWPRP